MKRARADEMGDTKSTDARPTILVIEGDDVWKQAYPIMLADLDWHLIVYTDAQEAVRVARAERPDVIIIDPQDVDRGVDVCWALQSHPVTNNIPVICVTTVWCMGDDVVLTGLEFAKFFSKPFRPDDLREAVQSVLETPVESMPRLSYGAYKPRYRPRPDSRWPKVLIRGLKRKLTRNLLGKSDST
jgi:DNA-binding response OmpR family regulator